MTTQNPFSEYFKNQALESIGYSHDVERALQTGHGFYKGQPWQTGYGIGGLFGSLARHFIPLLKPLAKAVGKRVVRAGADFANEMLEGKSVGKAGMKAISSVFKTQQKKNKKRGRKAPNVISKKRRKGEQDYFSK